MNLESRISSILEASHLDSELTGFKTFPISELKVGTNPDFELPNNLRLGHLIERIVSELCKASANYSILYENIQLFENDRTIGELDFILQEEKSKRIIHLELAYKFYLYDPTISSEPINNWIGPNRNDSLKEKLNKLKTKQFPLLYHDSAKSKMGNIDLNEVSQALCFLVSLFVPYDLKAKLDPVYERAIKGYYLNFETFRGLHIEGNTYYIPPKKEWGMNPADNESWVEFKEAEEYINICLTEKQAPLCWQKNEEVYTMFFVTWW